jgi:hypothetical protein
MRPQLRSFEQHTAVIAMQGAGGEPAGCQRGHGSCVADAGVSIFLIGRRLNRLELVAVTVPAWGHATRYPADIYKVDLSRADGFYAAIRAYWPDLPDGSLRPALSGIGPKIARPGGSDTEFLVQSEISVECPA